MLKIFTNHLSLPTSGRANCKSSSSFVSLWWFRKILQFLTLVKGDNKKNNSAFFKSYAPIFTTSIIQKFIFQQFLFKNSAECTGESE